MAKTNITLRLDGQEIAYEVKNKTWLAARSAEAAGAKPEAVSQLQVTDDEECDNMLRRLINNAVARLRHIANEWVPGGVTTDSNVLPGGTGTIIVTLAMPTNHALGAVEDTCQTMHRYIVDYACGAWYEVVDAERCKLYLAEAEADARVLRLALLRRRRPPRRQSDSGGDPAGRHVLWLRSEKWRRAEKWLRR